MYRELEVNSFNCNDKDLVNAGMLSTELGLLFAF